MINITNAATLAGALRMPADVLLKRLLQLRHDQLVANVDSQSDIGDLRQHKIGGFTDLTFDKARRKAQELRGRVVVGENPTEERKLKRQVPTVAELAERYMAHVRSYKRSADIDQRYLNNHILPRFGRMRLDEITQEQVVAWLDAKVKKEGYALGTRNRLHVVLSYMYKLAKRWGMPGSDVNPLLGVPLPNPNNERERFLTPEEARRLKAGAEADDNPMIKHIVALLLLTGCRKRELLDARWEDFDLTARQWKVPMAKSGKRRFVPLSLEAIAVIEQLPRWEGCPWLVPNPETKLPYTSIYYAWHRSTKRAGLKGLRIHDLRHSAASNMVNAGQSLYVVGQVLGHAQPRTTQRYAHLSQDTLLAAVDAAAGFMGTTWTETAPAS
ncbi:site-specific integrase [uncultured Sphingomonas sp.]|uniref:tyrosine-type recombinase/integrase n=1 Tax=uncultured Sphingomonas sp. TaxID=158754 RepID=UPI0025D76C69|nr:site-specific integrase [uncultured Sphingomonas sp.]